MLPPMKRVLFLCTGNSCRSHIAEGWLRHLAGERYESLSAGARPAGFVHPLAVKVMAEVGVDISGHTSKSLDSFTGQHLDYLITVCDNAAQTCPNYSGADQIVRWSFEDPAHVTGTAEEKLRVFRRVRDEIKEQIQGFLNG
jgi:arsenate reductase (thioredoxin)